MCFKVPCRQCGKTGWGGCGMHLASVFAGVPESERCRCKEEAYNSPPISKTPSVKRHAYDPYEEENTRESFARQRVNERISYQPSAYEAPTYQASQENVVKETVAKRQNPNFSIKVFRNRSNVSQARNVNRERVNLPSIRWQSNRKYMWNEMIFFWICHLVDNVWNKIFQGICMVSSVAIT